MAVSALYEVREPDVTELDQVQFLRHVVLDPARKNPVDEALSPEDFDPEAIHVAAFGPVGAVSAVRLDRLADTLYSVRKMATAPEYRRVYRLGSQVLQTAESIAQERGVRSFTLDARREAISFFMNNGYALTRREFTSSDGVRNYTMEKRVD